MSYEELRVYFGGLMDSGIGLMLQDATSEY